MEFKKLERTEVFRDPIYGYVYIDYQLIIDLINTSEMQRLKRIHQLGGTLQVFPTAEQSRFSHSLGTYEIVRRIFVSSKEIDETLKEEDKVVALCAALLHDIGHGPLSHAFEMIHPISHEYYTCAIIKGDSEINRVLSGVSPDFANKVASVIDHTHPDPILSQLISSQLDADRLDYMLRDAYFTGTTYGHVDLDRLLRGISAKKGRVVFKENNLSNVENIMFSRYHMYTQVYFHPVAFCYEVIVMNALKRFFVLKKNNYKFKNNYKYLEPFASNTALEPHVYVQMDDFVLFFYLKQFGEEDDSILSDLATRALNRKLLKYQHASENADVSNLRESVISKGYNPEYYYYEGELNNVIYQKYDRKDINTIMIKKRDGEVVELEKVSSIVKAITDRRNKTEKNKIIIYI